MTPYYYDCHEEKIVKEKEPRCLSEVMGEYLEMEENRLRMEIEDKITEWGKDCAFLGKILLYGE